MVPKSLASAFKPISKVTQKIAMELSAMGATQSSPIADAPTLTPSATAKELAATTSISRGGFRVSTRKLPILKAGPIEDMTNKLGITPPEMIFGDNFVQISHPESGWQIQFNALDALDRVDKTGNAMLQVAYSK